MNQKGCILKLLFLVIALYFKEYLKALLEFRFCFEVNEREGSTGQLNASNSYESILLNQLIYRDINQVCKNVKFALLFSAVFYLIDFTIALH